MQAMSVADVQNALDQLGLQVKVIEFESPTATSQQAADNIDCELGQIVKSLGFIFNKTTPVLVLASGDKSVDERKLAALFKVGRKKVRMMNAEQWPKHPWILARRRSSYRASDRQNLHHPG